MTFEGKPGTVDIHGGWFDATGDYGKHLSHLSYSSYFNPQQVSLTAWSLFMTLRELERRAEPNFQQYRKRLLDEALFGADYLVRSKDPNGSFYITVSGRGPEKKPEDRRITPKAERHIILTPETKDKFRDYGREKIAGDAAFEAGYREGAGLCIAALAMAAARGGAAGAREPGLRREPGRGRFQGRRLSQGRRGRLRLPREEQPPLHERRQGEYPRRLLRARRGRRSSSGRRASPRTRQAADRRAASLAARLTSWTSGGAGAAGGATPSGAKYENYWRADGEGGDRPFFHPVDAGLPVVSLLVYSEIADEAGRAKALDAVRKSLAFELAVTAEVANPFGYSRQLVQSKDGASTRRTSFFFPHDTETAPWWQGENARLGSMAAAARLAALAFAQSPSDSDRALVSSLRAFGRDQLNWILGLNPFDACMLHGHGRNNIPYMFFDSYEYTNAPGGICNGITGGYTDAADIDFGLRYAADGQGRRLALGRAVAAPRGVVPAGIGRCGKIRGKILRSRSDPFYLLNSATARKKALRLASGVPGGMSHPDEMMKFL